MPKRKAPKVINQEIIKAMQTLTNQNPYVVITLGDLVQEVKTQLKHIPIIGNSNKMIKEAIYNLRDLGLIDHVGFNQYCLADCFAKVEYKPPEPRMPSNKKTIVRKHFSPVVRKIALDNFNNSKSVKKSIAVFWGGLDPRRNKSSTSLATFSGSLIGKTGKRIHARKIIQKSTPNPSPHGSHQVPPRIVDKSDEIALKRRRFERYFKGEFSSEEDSDNPGVIIEEIPAEIWQDYEASLAKSRAQLKHGDKDDANNAGNIELEKVENYENVELTAGDSERNSLEGAKSGLKLKVMPAKKEPK